MSEVLAVWNPAWDAAAANLTRRSAGGGVLWTADWVCEYSRPSLVHEQAEIPEGWWDLSLRRGKIRLGSVIVLAPSMSKTVVLGLSGCATRPCTEESWESSQTSPVLKELPVYMIAKHGIVGRAIILLSADSGQGRSKHYLI